MATRKDIMLAYAFSQKRFDKFLAEDKAMFIQPKLNGDRCRAIINRQGVQLLSSSGRSRNFTCPHLLKQLYPLLHTFSSDQERLELDGELYIHGMSHQDIRKRTSRTRSLHPDHQQVDYYIFDVINEDRPQTLRLTDLLYIKARIEPEQERYPNLNIVPSQVISTGEELNEKYEHWLEKGFEGIILRRLNTLYIRKKTPLMMKLKPNISDYFLITGWEEEYSIQGQPKGRLGAFWMTDGQVMFKVGTGYTRDERIQFWKDRDALKHSICKVRYSFLSDEGIPSHARFEKICTEGEEED